jgi:hypothetical protein
MLHTHNGISSHITAQIVTCCFTILCRKQRPEADDCRLLMPLKLINVTVFICLNSSFLADF